LVYHDLEMGPHRRSSHDSVGETTNNANESDAETPNFDSVNGPWPCGIPKGHNCLYANDGNSEHIAITRDDLVSSEAVKILCSNDHCPKSPYLHSACFTAFEENILVYLKTQGRARGWSDKQRTQNLWTKRGYDLVYKACECSCGHGYVRKDLDWDPPVDEKANQNGELMGEGQADDNNPNEEVNGTKRKRKKSNSKSKGPTVTIGLPTFGHNHMSHEHHTYEQQQALNLNNSNNNTNTIGITNASTTVTTAQDINIKMSNTPSFTSNMVHKTLSGNSNIQSFHQGSNRNRTNSLSSNGSSGSSYGSNGSPPSADFFSGTSPGSNEGIQQPPRRALLQDRSRHDSGGSIFQRRSDYSSFNVLPKHMINSYHIKMEDECSIGNDETRIFILSSYASNKMNRVPCVLCKTNLNIFDRYPLLDGTFFLSPRQHNKTCIQVKLEGKTSFLTAVCMYCLEGWTGGGIVCRFCIKPWTGSHLILGTMYSYDIFAAMPCCAERFKCNSCNQLVCHPDQRFNFFSDYSQMVSCPNCGSQDAHFAKPLNIYMTKDEANKQLQLAQSFQQQLNMQQQQQAMQNQQANFMGNNINLQAQACGGAVGGPGFMNSGMPPPSAAVGGARVHRVNSA